jgi:hypothetical protein
MCCSGKGDVRRKRLVLALRLKLTDSALTPFYSVESEVVFAQSTLKTSPDSVNLLTVNCSSQCSPIPITSSIDFFLTNPKYCCITTFARAHMTDNYRTVTFN